MRLSAILFFLLLIGACSPKGPFDLQEATSRHWSAGIKGSGSGTMVEFSVTISSDQEVEFTRAWVADSSCALKLIRMKMESIGTVLKEGEKVTLQCRFVNGEKTDRLKPPMEYDGAALIEYLLDGVTTYYEVKELKTLEKRISY